VVIYVKKIIEVKNGVAVVEREFEDGYEEIEVPLPALLTVTKEINTPRLPSLKGKMKAKAIQISTWSATDIQADSAKIGLKASPTRVVKIFNPPVRTNRQTLHGEAGEIAKTLVGKLKETRII
jgi:electron transfer flavoprotein beta subunit